MAAGMGDRRVRLNNKNTNERVEVSYYSRGVYNPRALEELNHFLRCHYTGEVTEMDVRVIDVLSQIQRTVGRDRTLEVVSGYRSPAYNDYLRRHGRGVARQSFHIAGQAIDFSIPGISNRRLARLARSTSAGGIGTYSRFIHIDSGPVRSW